MSSSNSPAVNERLMELESALMLVQRDFDELNSVVLAQRAELDRQRTVIAELQQVLQRAMPEGDETTDETVDQMLILEIPPNHRH
ncbi:SlyX family protein [Thalassoroseus pseudoceratinae]|uniref:SlyX family protein n=1 Tax=Thalassoroseus pseudoceratinae TaxID=2713176 RepID=UPI0014244F30|nr:SlyX family protein [Thalassoroseus pseudoceratinae]